MGSEDQVLNLMRLLDDGIQKAETIESKLDSYDKILQVKVLFIHLTVNPHYNNIIIPDILMLNRISRNEAYKK